MLRDFQTSDFDAVIALLHAGGVGHYPNDPERDLARIIEAQESRIFVYEENGLGGVIVASNDGRRGWLYYLSVREDLRKQGIGSRLMRHAEDWLRSRGVPKVLFLVRDDNLEKTARLYHELGYREEACTCFGRWLVEPPKET